MPRTASTQNTDSPKPRPQAPVRQRRLLESTPVLFRLPAVEQISLATTEDKHGQATDHLAGVDEPRRDWNRAGDQLGNSKSNHATAGWESPQFQTVHTPSSEIPTPQIASRLHTLQLEPNEIESQQLTAHGRGLPRLDAASAPATQTATTTRADVKAAPAQSWWEHWSSGVVLILLIIALITASIMAFSDSSGNNSELVADGLSSAADVPQIPDIELPSVSELTPSPAASTHASSVASPAVPPPAMQSTALASSNTQPGTESQASPTSAVDLQLVPADLALGELLPEPPTDSKDLVSSRKSDVSTVAANNFVANSQTARTLNNSGGATPRTQAELQADSGFAKPLASLDVPVGIEVPDLFPSSGPDDSSFDAMELESIQGVTAVPASTNNAGQSPSLYDGAMGLPSRSPASPGAPPAFVANPGPIDTRLPAYSAVSPSSSTKAPIKSVSLQNGPIASTPEAALPANEAAPGVRQTLTPDSDADAFIKAWQRFNAMNNAGGNRYPSDTGAPTSNTQTGTPATGMTGTPTASGASSPALSNTLAR